MAPLEEKKMDQNAMEVDDHDGKAKEEATKQSDPQQELADGKIHFSTSVSSPLDR